MPWFECVEFPELGTCCKYNSIDTKSVLVAPVDKPLDGSFGPGQKENLLYFNLRMVRKEEFAAFQTA